MKRPETQKEIDHLTQKRVQLANDLDGVRLDLLRVKDDLAASYLNGGSQVERLTVEMGKLVTRESAILSAMQTAETKTNELTERMRLEEQAAENVRHVQLANEIRQESLAHIRDIYDLEDRLLVTMGKTHEAKMLLSKDGTFVSSLLYGVDQLRCQTEQRRMDLLNAAGIQRRGKSMAAR